MQIVNVVEGIYFFLLCFVCLCGWGTGTFWRSNWAFVFFSFVDKQSGSLSRSPFSSVFLCFGFLFCGRVEREVRGGNKKHTCAWDNCDHEGQQLRPKEEKKIHNFKDDTQRSIEDAISGKDMKVIENNEKTRLKE